MSEPVIRGAIEVTTEGQPIIFMADHPTTCGYPVIAVLEPKSADLAAQLRPGDTARISVSGSQFLA
jgi:allophanate hydrolase subunit 2